MNNCTFIGHVSDEPTRKQTGTGKSMLIFTLHVRYGTGDWAKSVYIKGKCFGQVADGVPYLDKGSLVSAVGEYSPWKADDGTWKPMWDFRAVAVLDNAPQHSSQQLTNKTPSNEGFSSQDDWLF
jgi:single-stranded DNA-binding protein